VTPRRLIEAAEPKMKTHAAREPDTPARRAERGYSLVALLALMTVLMIMMMAAAPSLRQQSQRERELEAIARGEQVAEAIRMFVHYTNPHRLPTSMEELQKGAPVGPKNVQVLRASSARDPLSESGEWRLIKVNDRAMIAFIQALTRYTDGHLPQQAAGDPALAQVAQMPRVTGVLDLETVEDSSGGCGGDDDSLTSTGPFVGVASRSDRESVVTYYGIDRPCGWVFTPYYR
jgi:competence protein ComGC